MEDACEMYARAANMFKMAKNWSGMDSSKYMQIQFLYVYYLCPYFNAVYYPAAGNAFCQAAKLHMQMQNKLDAATSYVDAGNAYKKADPQGENAVHNELFATE